MSCFNEFIEKLHEFFFAVLKYDKEEIEKLRIVENLAVQTFLNGPYRAKSRYIARNMMTDER